MANIESGKIFDIDISISKFIEQYGSIASYKQYCQWFVSQLASVLHIDESYFNLEDIGNYTASCLLPYINQPIENIQQLACDSEANNGFYINLYAPNRNWIELGEDIWA